MSADENQNLIPDKIDRLGLRICSVLSTAGGGLVAYFKPDVPMWLAVGLIGVGAITGLFAFSGGGK